jgi:hypothetical protein
VGVRLDAGRHPHVAALPDAEPGGHGRDPLEVVERVDDEAPHPRRDGALDLLDRLVVAVEQHALGRHPAAQGHRQLPARAHVDRQALLSDPAGDRGAEERLGGVVDLLAAEGRAPLAAARAEVVLVQHVRRRAELRGQLAHVDPAQAQGAVVAALGGARPDDRLEVGAGPVHRLQRGHGLTSPVRCRSALTSAPGR